MNRFKVLSCIPKSEDNDSSNIVLSCISDPSFLIFFPIPESTVPMFSYLIEGGDEYDFNTNILGLYKTIIESWLSSGKFLSGIILDSVYDKKGKEDVLLIRLALSDQKDGGLESVVPISFVHAIYLAIMQNVHIIIGDDVLEKMVPKDSEEFEKINDRIVNKPHPKFPEDKDILDIAKQIMSGKVKIKSKDKPKHNKDKSDK